MRVEHHLGQRVGRLVTGGELGLDDVERAGWSLLLRDRVDDHQDVVPLEELVDQVHRADPEVHDLDTVRQRRAAQGGGHLDPEAVVGQEDVADAGDQHAGHQVLAPVRGSTSSGAK